MYYIYKIHSNMFNGTYIGRTNNYKRRFGTHRSELKHGRHPCKEMQHDYNVSMERGWGFPFVVLMETEDKRTSELLETLFIYRSYAHKEKLYNQHQIWFPDDLIDLRDDSINSIIDNRMILCAYFHHSFGERRFKEICKELGKEYLLDVVYENAS